MRNKMLVYIVWVFMLALGVQSCHQPDVQPEPMCYPILFGSSDTRAIATIENLKTEGFKVHAYFKGNEGDSTFYQDVVYKESQNVWDLETTEYWIPGATYWFKTFYPKDLAVDITTNAGASQSFSISNYDITSQQDIMIASPDPLTVPLNGVAPDSGSVVNLNFDHKLACVVINTQSELVTPVTISKVELRGVALKGGYDGTTWTSSDRVNLGRDINITLQIAESDTDYTDITEGGFLVIPEKVNGVQKVYINTSYKEYEIALPTDPSWESGQKYTYTLVIKQDNIVFNEPKVEIWDEENATGSVVIK